MTVDDAIVKMIEKSYFLVNDGYYQGSYYLAYSLEGEFEVQKSIQFIDKLEDIELLKPYSIKLLTNKRKASPFCKQCLRM